jgi:hypothetical protein
MGYLFYLNLFKNSSFDSSKMDFERKKLLKSQPPKD